MSGGGKSGAPIDDGGADLAIGSAGVAALCAGGRLVGKGSAGMSLMNVAVRLIRPSVNLTVYIDISHGEHRLAVGIADLTQLHRELHIQRIELA